MKRVIIVGCGGQDGRLLFEKLQSAGNHVLGINRDSIQCTEPYLASSIDVANQQEVLESIRQWYPDEIYYLAAYHHSSQDLVSIAPLELFHQSFTIHVKGLLNFLEAIRVIKPTTRLFYAASSLVFGDASTPVQNESTPFNPKCVYGITKTSGIHCCQLYRKTHGIFASSGILYNHESIYRQEKFVSQKIMQTAIKIANGEATHLDLGDLSVQVDWGYAPDYVDAMEQIIMLDNSDEFIIATGESHTVKEMVEIVFEHLDLDWKKFVRVDPSLIMRERPLLVGDASKLHDLTGWRPSVSFSSMIKSILGEQCRAT